MKKHINLFAWLLILLMSVGAIPVHAMEVAAETANVLVNEDFTTGGGQLIYTSNAGWLKTIEFDQKQNAYMVLTKKENVASQGVWEVGNISNTSAKQVVFEYDFNIMEQDSSFRCWLRTNSEILSTTYVYKGTFVCDEYTKVLDLNTWYRLSAVVDYSRFQIIYYLNGEKIKTAQFGFWDLSTSNKITSVRFNRADKFGDYTGMLSDPFKVGIDNVRFYDASTPLTDVPAVEKTITLTGASVFSTDQQIAQGLNGYIAVHKRSGVVFANGAKTMLPTTPTEDGEIAARELAAILGVTLDASVEETMKVETFMTDVLGKQIYVNDTTINSGMVIAGAGTYPAPTDETSLQKLNDYLFYYSPSASQLKALYEASGKSNVHPRIQADATDFDRLRTAYNSNSNAYITKWIDSLITEADSLLDKSPVTYGLTDGTRMSATGEKMQRRMYALGMAYQITGNEKYARRAYKELEAVSNFYDWNPYHTLDMSTFAVGVAIGYDWMYHAFTPEERAVIEKGVYNNAFYDAVLLYQGQMSTMRSNTYSTENWNGVINGGYAMLTLAMADVYPDISFMLLEHNVRALQEMLGGFAPDGAWHEGPDYWRYLMEYLTKGLDAIESVLGTDLRIPTAEGLSTAGQYMIHMHGTQGIFTYGDGASREIYFSPLMWLSNKYDQPWLTTALLKNTNGILSDNTETAMAVLWYDPNMKEADLSLERDAYYTGDEVVTMRSSFVGSEYTYAAFHAGDNKDSHGHLDAGSFVFESDGIRWITELGKGNYNQTGYFDVKGGGRWKIFRMRAEGHSTLVINPLEAYDQDTLSVSKVTRMESEESGVIVCADLTDAYNEFNASSVMRGLQFVDHRQSLVLRDEMTLLDKEGGNEVYWFLMTETEIVSSKVASDGLSGSLQLRSGTKTMTIDYITTQPAVLSYDVAGPIYDTIQNLDNETAKQIALKFTGITGDLAITAKFTPGTVVMGSDVADYAVAMSEWEITEPNVLPVIPEENGSYVFKETFDDATYETGIGFFGNGWTRTTKNGYVLCQKTAAKQAYFDVEPSKISSGTKAVYKTDFYLEEVGSPFRLMLFTEGTTASSTLDVINVYGGKLVYGEYSQILEANRWYTVSAVFDYANGKVFYYLDDVCFGTMLDTANVSMDSQLIKVRVNFADKINGISGNLEKDFKVRYDNVKVYGDYEVVATPTPAPTPTPTPTPVPTATPEPEVTIPNIPTTYGTELFLEKFDGETHSLSVTNAGCTQTMQDGYLLLESANNEKQFYCDAIFAQTSAETAAMINLKFYLDDINTKFRLPVYFGAARATDSMSIQDGAICRNNDANAKAALSAETWHTLTILADYENNTAYYYLDGVCFSQFTDATMISQESQVYGIRLFRHKNDSNLACKIRFDEIAAYGVMLKLTPTPAPTATPTPAPTPTPTPTPTPEPKYTVTWVNIDGTVLEVDENLDPGTMPTYDGKEPSMTSDTATLTYKGWDKKITPVTGNVTYTANYHIDGIYGGYYYIQGILQKNKGVIQYGEDLYFVHYSGKLSVSANQTVTEKNANGLVSPGTYYFNAKGIMRNPADDQKGYIHKDENGVLWYYVKGEVRANVGVVKIGEYYYYVCYSGKLAQKQNMTVPLGKLNGHDIEAKTYYFFADGVMETREVTITDGEEGEDGKYYVHTEPRTNVGVVEMGDYLYYVHYSGKIVKGSNQTITEKRSNGYVSEGTYYCFKNGVLETPEVRMSGEVKDDWKYYVFDELKGNVGLVKIGEDFYYVHYSGKVVTNGYQTITEAKCNGYTEFVGTQKFVDGKMVMK